MKIRTLIFFLLFLFPILSWTQIKGKVVDASDNSPLPFATILGENTYAIANEEGEFTYRGNVGERLSISFLGYRDTIVIAKRGILIKMENDGILSEEIVISDANYISPYKLLLNAKKQYKSLDQSVIKSKLFVKRESINNGVWSDQTETLYSISQYKGKIFKLSFQHGKSYINNKNDLILTLDLLAVLEEEELFSKYSKYLFTSACSLGSEKKMKKNFQGNYREWQSNGNDYYIIDFSSRKDNKFDSELTVSIDDYDLIRLRQEIRNPSESVFRSLLTDKPIDLDSLSLEYIFDDFEGQKVISSLLVSYSYHLNGVHSANTIQLKFFDYGKPFADIISAIDYTLLTDYQRIWNTPYDEEFWEGQNLTFSKLDTLSDYEDINLKSSNLLLNKRYLTISDVHNIGVSHFEHIPRMDDGKKAIIKFTPIDMKTQRHVNAHLFTHFYTIDDQPKIKVVPLIDYYRSFVIKNSPMMDSMFMKEIRIVDLIAKEAALELESIDLTMTEKTLKTIRKIIRRYNKILKKRLSELDAYQDKDWSASHPGVIESIRTRRH